jgi:hypothetical protein
MTVESPAHRIALAPTSDRLLDDAERPYFVWWADITTGEFKRLLVDPDLDRRAYWLGALLREANTRDVWVFTRPSSVRELWPRLSRHLGKTRDRWAWLLGIDAEPWPPPEAWHAR